VRWIPSSWVNGSIGEFNKDPLDTRKEGRKGGRDREREEGKRTRGEGRIEQNQQEQRHPRKIPSNGPNFRCGQLMLKYYFLSSCLSRLCGIMTVMCLRGGAWLPFALQKSGI
jgi:hypothetical protein